MRDQQARNFGGAVFEELRLGVLLCVVRASGVLVFLQAVVTMGHEMADAKKTKIDPANGMLRAFSRVARDGLAGGPGIASVER